MAKKKNKPLKNSIHKRKSSRAQIIRRKTKSGKRYYYNKKTKKNTSKSSWYKYRAWAIKQKPRREVYKEKERININPNQPLYKIDINKASESALRQEANRLRLGQVRWANRLKSLRFKKNKKKVRAHLRRLARHINAIEKILGEYTKPRGFEEESYTIGDNVLVDNIYKWEAKKFIDGLVESEDYDKFIIQGELFIADDPVSIGIAIDDLETQADFSDIYYFRVTQNSKTRTVHVTLFLD